MKRLKKLSRKYVNSLPKLKAPEGYVYLLQNTVHVDVFKIGKTNYPARRVYEFGVLNPYPLSVIFVKRASNASAAETHLHRRFRKSRLEGEWFKLNETDINVIEKWDVSRIQPPKPKKKQITRKPTRRRKQIKQIGWSERDWSEEEWLSTDSEIDTDVDYDEWDFEAADNQHWELEDTDVDLPEGDVEDTIEFENLAGKNLAGMILSAKDLSHRDLSYANLWGSDLSYTYFVSSDLTEVDFTDAEMQDTDLRHANLKNSNLTGADLRGASLVGANLQGANLTAAELSKAVLTGAIYDEFTILPNGKLWSSEADITRFTR